jgi:hypothetical protein
MLEYEQPKPPKRVSWRRVFFAVTLLALAYWIFQRSWWFAHNGILPAPDPPEGGFRPLYGLVVIAGVVFVPMGVAGLYLIATCLRTAASRKTCGGVVEDRP